MILLSQESQNQLNELTAPRPEAACPNFEIFRPHIGPDRVQGLILNLATHAYYLVRVGETAEGCYVTMWTASLSFMVTVTSKH